MGTGYWPDAQDLEGHRAANLEFCEDVAYLRAQGYSLMYGGDLNAHTGSNFDRTPKDKAGKMLMETVDFSDMVLLNTVPGLCAGGPTREQETIAGVQASTLDYALCSPDLLPYVKSMEICEKRMSSDHRPLVLTVEGLQLKRPKEQVKREIWNLTGIEDEDWTAACQERFGSWVKRMDDFVRTVRGTGQDPSKVANLLDWSIQHCLDEVCAEKLGTKWVGPSAVPVLDAASRMAISHRDVCEDAMRWVMSDGGAPDRARTEARTQFLAASRRVVYLATHKRELAELKLFRDVESKQRDSKLFWGRVKKASLLTNRLRLWRWTPTATPLRSLVPFSPPGGRSALVLPRPTWRVPPRRVGTTTPTGTRGRPT